MRKEGERRGREGRKGREGRGEKERKGKKEKLKTLSWFQRPIHGKTSSSSGLGDKTDFQTLRPLLIPRLYLTTSVIIWEESRLFTTLTRIKEKDGLLDGLDL